MPEVLLVCLNCRDIAERASFHWGIFLKRLADDDQFARVDFDRKSIRSLNEKHWGTDVTTATQKIRAIQFRVPPLLADKVGYDTFIVHDA